MLLAFFNCGIQQFFSSEQGTLQIAGHFIGVRVMCCANGIGGLFTTVFVEFHL
jgi:hypothetical protein